MCEEEDPDGFSVCRYRSAPATVGDCRQTADGQVVDTVRIDNDPVALSCAVAEAGPNPEVVVEATYGWYWAVDVLQACGATVHLAHPLGVKAFAYRRVKKRRA